MRIEFKTHYVEEGSLSFDNHGRWRIDIYMFADFNSLPNYSEHKPLFVDSFPVIVGHIFQKGSSIGNVPSTHHQFCALIPSFEYALNGGFDKHYVYDNDLNKLKENVVNQLNEVYNVFKYAK